MNDFEQSVDSSSMLSIVFDIANCLGENPQLLEDIQRFMCMFISRIIDINPATELFPIFFERVANGNVADLNLSYLEPLLRRALLEYGETSQLQSLFTDYIFEYRNYQ